MRPVLFQTLTSFTLAVGTVPTAIKPTANFQAELINSFVISVPASAANNVFLGDSNVSLVSGMEIIAGGGPVSFEIMDERMRYELLSPLQKMLEVLTCGLLNFTPSDIPFTCWDLSQVFVIATAATNVSITTFKKQFI